jgi:hypothetical protein
MKKRLTISAGSRSAHRQNRGRRVPARAQAVFPGALPASAGDAAYIRLEMASITYTPMIATVKTQVAPVTTRMNG